MFAGLLLASLTDAEAAARLRPYAVPLSDPVRIVQALKGAEVVGLGEATHGSREIFQTKTRLFQLLVERAGYTVLAFETSLPEGARMDRYVLNGEGEPDELVKGLSFWTWSTEEIRDLLRWMRRYNLDPKHPRKLRVVGIDAQNGEQVWRFLLDERRAAGLTSDAALEKLDYDRTVPMGDDVASGSFLAKVVSLSEEARPLLRRCYGDARADLIGRAPTAIRQSWEAMYREVAISDIMDYRVPNDEMTDLQRRGAAYAEAHPELDPWSRWGLRQLSATKEEGTRPPSTFNLRRAARALDRDSRSRVYGEDSRFLDTASRALASFSGAVELSRIGNASLRDRNLANSVEWIRQSYLSGQKVAIWAHNSHVGMHRAEPRSVAAKRPGSRPLMMGAYLADAIGPRYYPIGFVFAQGGFRAGTGGAKIASYSVGEPKPGSLDAVLSQVGPSPFFLDLRALPRPEQVWMKEPRSWRNVGSTFYESNPEAHYETVAAGETYAGLVFVNRITPARPLTR